MVAAIMRFDDLELLKHISRFASLHAAANTLGLTQSALSKVLVRLEEEAGGALFERSSRGIVMTPTGSTLLRHAQAITQAVDDMRTELGAERSAQAGLIRLAALPHLVPSLITPLIADFHKHRPMARFRISVLLSPYLLGSLVDATSDLVIAVMPPAVDAQLAFDSLGKLRVCMVACESHPRLSSFDRLESLVDEQWVLPDRTLYARRWFEQRFIGAGLPVPQVAVESSQSQTAFSHLIRHSDLLGLMPERSLSLQEGAGLRRIEGEALQFDYELQLFWRRGAPLSPVAQEFRDALLARGNASVL